MNAYCEALGIEAPRLESFPTNREVNTYTRLILALLERGGPMTLVEVADRFEEAGVAFFDRALLSLQRCKPGRAPVVRDGERYELDVRDREMESWLWRLGLRTSTAATPAPSASGRPEPPPLRNLSEPILIEELDEAWKETDISSWSAQRVALAVLDAHSGPLAPPDVVQFVSARTTLHRLRVDEPSFQKRNSGVAILADGTWSIADRSGDPFWSMRTAVRELIERNRKRALQRRAPEDIEESLRNWEAKVEAERLERAKLRRAILYAYPRTKPHCLALLDVAARAIETFVGDELERIPARLQDFDWVGAMEVRTLVRALGFEHGERLLIDLGPPRKTKQLDKGGRKLAITNELLIFGTCGISRAFGDESKLSGYLRAGEDTKLRRRLEASVKHLFAFYEYGRLHGYVRLRWGFLDETITAPWCAPLETILPELKKQALKSGAALEVVIGSAPGWSDPWSRAIVVHVNRNARSWHNNLLASDGVPIDDRLIQAARLVVPPP